MQADTLSTIYTLLADNNLSSAETSLTTELYELLPSIAVIDPENYLSHCEHLKNLTRHIEHLLTHTATSKVSIGVGGGFSTGKSRFINTLLNLDILPEAIEPCTAVATYLTYSESDHTQALNIFDSTIDIEQQQLKQLRHFIGDDSENTLNINQLIKHVTINSQKIKWQNISFLDTPGYSKADATNSIVNDEGLALIQLNSVDHIVWLVSAKNGMIRDDDIKFLHQIDHHNPIFVVITQADLVNQEDVLPIMQGVQQHLEKNNIAIAGLMAWAAPAYEFEGRQVAGDDIKIWLDKLNNEEHDTHLSDFIDCCQDLIQLSSDRVLKLLQDSDNSNAHPAFKGSLISASESEKLIELLKTEQERILTFMNRVVDLAKNHSAFDWSLAHLYESNKLKGDIEDAIAIYHNQAKNNPDKAIKKLSKIVFNEKSIEAIIVLANIYEELLNDIKHSAEYHMLLLNSQPNIQQASKSWSWLFDNAITQTSVFNDLQELVTNIGDAKHYYHFALLAETLNKYEICAKFMFASAELSFNKALFYIEEKTEVDDFIRLQLGSLYQSSPIKDNDKKAIKIYKKLAFDNNKKAIYQLEIMAQKDKSVLALATLAELYEDCFNDIKKASSYHLKISSLSSKESNGVTSLDWLFKNALVFDEVFYDLNELVNKLNKKELDYKFGVLAGKRHKPAISKQYIVKSANKFYLPAVNWIVKNSQNDTELMLELASIYGKFNNPEDIIKSLKIYEELAIADNEQAFSCLETLAKKNLSVKAMAILAATYSSKGNVDKAAYYYSMIITNHPNSDNTRASWIWLFNNAKVNKQYFIQIKNLVDKSATTNINYNMANQALADLYENLYEDIESSAKYHILVSRNGSNTLESVASWEWLFDKAKTQANIFKGLQSLVVDVGHSEHYYKFALLAETLKKYQTCATFMFEAAQRSFDKALIYIEDETIDDQLKINFGELYQRASTTESYKKAVYIYKNLAKNNNQKALIELESMIEKDTSSLVLETLAEIYEYSFNDIKRASNCHIKISKILFKVNGSATSLDWLFKNAKVYDDVYYDLYKLINDLSNQELNYRFGILAESLGKFEVSTKFILNSANENYELAIRWLESKSENDPELMLELAAVYDKYNNSENIDKSLKIYEELAIAKNEKALKSLDVLARMTASLKAMDILAKIYVSENNNSKATDYNLLIVKHYPKSDVAETSWNWLFNNAENDEKIFIKLKNIVNQGSSIDIAYRMAELLDKMDDINGATVYYLSVISSNLESVNKVYSWNWVLSKAENNQDVLTSLERFIEKCNSVENIYKMAKFYEKINHIDISADYHYRVIKIYPESDVAKYSWDWLFHHAKISENAFILLKNVVDKSNSPDTNYRMVSSLEEIGNHDLATEYAAKNALANHSESEDWLLKKAKNIKHPARRKLLALYAKHNYKKIKQENIYSYFIENILIKDKEAFKNLEYIAENSDEYKAIWLLSLCYQHGICVEKNYQKSYYCLKTADGHIEEARYNLDVMAYSDIRKKYPLTYEARLFITPLITTKPPLFEKQGSLRYMFYLSLLTPEFISFDEKEPSYSINYMTWLMLIFLIVLLVF